MSKGQHLGGVSATSHGEACRVKRVTFFNGNAAIKGVVLSHYSLPATNVPLKLFGAAGITSQFDFEGFPFPAGFVVTPSAIEVTNVIVEYEAGIE